MFNVIRGLTALDYTGAWGKEAVKVGRAKRSDTLTTSFNHATAVETKGRVKNGGKRINTTHVM